ncbi:MAG TPA: pentapeptide repeat-containing protein [Ktedonobacterales bacterium]|jgi:hypothetical protein
MQQPALTPQQEAIREIRARYEQGNISFDHFEYALNALIQAQTPEECRGIVQELSTLKNTALDALTPPTAPASVSMPRQVQLITVLGELKRMRRPWKMGQRTRVLMGIGSLKLDLRMATIPPQALLEVYSLIGEAKIYVPRNIHVTVRQFILIGENKALGEERNGIFSMLEEEEFPAEGPDAASAPHLTIHQMMLIGSAQIIPSGGPGTLFSGLGARLSGLGEDLQGIDLRGANLEGADLSGKNLEGAKLIGANLRGVDFHGANLRKANLLGANLEEANLSGADLTQAKLFGVNLNGANLTGASLGGANLRGTNLEGAIAFGAQSASAPPSLPQPR